VAHTGPDETLQLRVLIAERPGGRLSTLAGDFPIDWPLDFEVEDRLDVVASLAAQNAFDLMVIGESLFGKSVRPEIVRSLADASEMTPILVLGEHLSEFHEGIETGSLRMVRPARLCPSSFLREIRQTLEMHVLTYHSPEQERRILCLCRIFDSMLDRMPYAVAVTDSDGDVCFLNSAARNLWPDLGRGALGMHLLDHPEEGRAEILRLGTPKADVEVAPVPIEWMGEQYFLTSMRRVSATIPRKGA
jgi:PAS domain-containing protein